MKPTYKGFEAKKSSGFVDMPPKGAYVAEIKKAEEIDLEFLNRKAIKVTLDICEGEYKDRYADVWRSQEERFGSATFKGTFNLIPPVEGDEEWRKISFEGNMWAIQQSNEGYKWDWDEKKLKGKKVGISVRNRLYTYNEQDRSTTEIAEFVPVEEVRAGTVKLKKDRDQRKNKDEDSTDGSEFTDVSKNVDVPWA